jgi:osmotically-inducible protein OsmY
MAVRREGSRQYLSTRQRKQKQGKIMKRFGISATLATALLLGMMTGCASDGAKHETVGQYIDDAALTANVKAAIVADPRLKAGEINVETYQGTVQLSGFVAQADDVAKAAQVARTVKGVKSVKNDLRLK